MMASLGGCCCWGHAAVMSYFSFMCFFSDAGMGLGSMRMYVLYGVYSILPCFFWDGGIWPTGGVFS